MKQFFFLLLCLFALAPKAQAVPADSVKRTVVQPDGTSLQLTLYGDEHRHCYLTADHIPVFETAEGFRYGRI